MHKNVKLNIEFRDVELENVKLIKYCLRKFLCAVNMSVIYTKHLCTFSSSGTGTRAPTSVI